MGCPCCLFEIVLLGLLLKVFVSGFCLIFVSFLGDFLRVCVLRV